MKKVDFLLKTKVEDSLQKRYLYKLATNLVSLFVNIIIQAIIPRGLGPKAYGDFNFLTNFFSQVISFFDMGNSTAFYTKLSQRPKEFGLVSFFVYYSGIISIVTIGFVFVSYLTSISDYLWPEQSLFLIYLAAVWGIFTWIVQVLNKMTDAYGVTVPAELSKSIQKILALILIIILLIFNELNSTNIFYYYYITLFFLGGAFIWVMENSGNSLFRQDWRLSIAQIRRYFKEYYLYSHPLFTYALMGMLVGILDRWLLQIYGGSVQQGFYGLSYQIGSLCFIFTSAMTPLLMREFSIAFGNKDLIQMATLFRRYIPMLYAIAAYFSSFVSLQADKVIYIMGGQNYSGAVMSVAIMALYPIHQTYGQLSGSVFYATGQTSLYRNIGIIIMFIGLPVTYFLIAPMDKMGFDAGATGLAIKMVLLQFIGVNIQLYYNAKFLNLSFWRYFGHQILTAGCFLMIAFISTQSADKLIGESIIASFILAGIVYTSLIVGLVYLFPVILGIKRQDIERIFKLIGNFVNGQ